jgi:hypothetical protein
MRKEDLLEYVHMLDPDVPRHKELEKQLCIGVGYGSAWYASQQEHWIRWLSDYDTAGVYGRRVDPDRDSQYIYSRIMCPPMLYWLAEASGVSNASLESAFAAVISAKPNPATRCGALRGKIAWGDVENCLRALPHQTEIADICNSVELER